MEDVETLDLPHRARQVVDWSGRIGYPAKGVAYGTIGVLFLLAALRASSEEAGGLEEGVTTLLAGPVRPVPGRRDRHRLRAVRRVLPGPGPQRRRRDRLRPGLSDRVLLRRAEPDDAAAVARCHGACWREAYSALVPPGFFDATPDGLGAERWRELLGRPEVDVAVAVAGGRGGRPGQRGPADRGRRARQLPRAAGAAPARAVRAGRAARLRGRRRPARRRAGGPGRRPCGCWRTTPGRGRSTRGGLRRRRAPPRWTRWTGLVEVRMVR